MRERNTESGCNGTSFSELKRSSIVSCQCSVRKDKSNLERYNLSWQCQVLGDVLADGEDVAAGVLEPGYAAAVGGGPDAEGLVLGEGNLFRGDAAVAEPGGEPEHSQEWLCHWNSRHGRVRGVSGWAGL